MDKTSELTTAVEEVTKAVERQEEQLEKLADKLDELSDKFEETGHGLNMWTGIAIAAMIAALIPLMSKIVDKIFGMF